MPYKSKISVKSTGH